MDAQFRFDVVKLFFFNDTATTEIYTLSLHDALPIYYTYDYDNRLKSVTGQYQGQALNLQYEYDYRGRRVNRGENGTYTSVVFSGGTSVQEWSGGVIAAEYVRGSDWGGGVGGMLYSLRFGQIGFTHYNHRGGVGAKTKRNGALTV